MRLAVVGGKLQGVEAAYLARKAGWEVRLVDRREDVPARGLCDSFLRADIGEEGAAERAFRGVDLVLPALEDAGALAALVGWAGRSGAPLAFDPQAYGVSSSKLASNRLIRRLDLPRPRPWPECRFPLIVKPDGGSGSRGVQVCARPAELEAALEEGGAAPAGGRVVEEFLAGPSYSLEVLGAPGGHRTLQVTDLEMDAVYDCKRVRAPSELPPQQVEAFRRQSLALAAALRLKGLMDVEAILHEGQLKVLEIDARLPSQTPIAVYWSTGWNMVQLLGELYRPASEEPASGAPARPPAPPAAPRGVVLEHISVNPARVEVAGEHVMAVAEPLRLLPGFFGAQEAITNYAPGRKEWVATLIVTAGGREEAWKRRLEVIGAIHRLLDIPGYLDPQPPLPELRR